MMLRHFLTAEDGAVAVDWVVLSAGLAGLGLATISVVSAGIESLSGDISDHLSGIELTSAFAAGFEAVQLALDDFSGGARGNWTGGHVADLGGALGSLLQLGAGDAAEWTMDVPAGASQVVLSFDLLGIDSLDSESATITLNGQVVSIATGNHGSMSFANGTIPGVTVETAVVTQRAQLGGSSDPDWLESRSTVRLTIDNPGGTISLGVVSGTDQGRADESFGLDNMSARAL